MLGIAAGILVLIAVGIRLWWCMYCRSSPTSTGLLHEHGRRSRITRHDQLEMAEMGPVADAKLRAEMKQALARIGDEVRFGPPAVPPGLVTTRFEASVREMVIGQPKFAALGLDHFMRVPSHMPTPSLDDGVAAVVRQVTEHGDEMMRECLHYVLHEEAGSSPLTFDNFAHPRDCDEHGVRADRKTASGNGMRLADFVADHRAVSSSLHVAHVLAVRLYTTAAFVHLNKPMRQLSPDGSTCAEPHPFPNTVRFIAAAIKQLRTNSAPVSRQSSAQNGPLLRGGVGEEPLVRLDRQYLYRGCKGMRPSDGFMVRGGSELGTMSTTTELEVAMRYAASDNPMILRLSVENFMQYGAEIAFLSAFPSENEVVYPPLTYIMPTRQRTIEGIVVIDASVTVA